MSDRPSVIQEDIQEDTRLNLGQDLAALLSFLLIFILYHIQHPTLLFRVQFGETFRDVREEGFQNAIVWGLALTVFVLVGSWGRLWGNRQLRLNRLWIAMLGVVGLYILYTGFLIIRESNFFLHFYDLSAEAFDEELRMSRSRAAILANPIKVLSATGLLGGIGLASLLYLWSPWESIRSYYKLSQNPPAALWKALLPVLSKDALGIVSLALWFYSYRVINLLWRYSSETGDYWNQQDRRILLGWGLLIVAEILVAVQLYRNQFENPRTRHLYIAIGVVFTLYALHSIAVLWQESNYFAGYYGVSAGNYDEWLVDSEFLGSAVMINALKITDWASILAGMALVSVLYIWGPWERLKLYRNVVIGNFPALMVAAHILFIWETVVILFDIEQFLLPKPTVIWDTFKEIYPGIIAGSWYTFQNAIRGFAYGCGAGILTGMVAARWPNLSKAVMPLAVAANAVPIIAFAPISNQWFGFTNPNSKAAIAAVLCYFPAMISTVQGLNSVQSVQLELMRSYAASEFEIFRKLRLPNALPYMFSAFKLAATLSMIGAIVAEFFGGSPATALGFSITDNARRLRITDAWSGIIVASLLGIGFYMLVSVLERTAMPWHGSFRSNSR